MKKTTNALILCVEKIPTVTVGILRVFDYITNSENFQYEYRNSFNTSYKDFINADIIILVRATTSHELRICELAKKHNKLLIYYLDDDLLNVPRQSITFAHMENEKIRENMVKIMQGCDILWAVSSNLINKYKDYFSRTCRIDAAYEINMPDKPLDKDKIKILFAGSIDHGHGITVLLKEAIKNLLFKYEDKIKVIFVGAKPSFIDEYSQIECHAYKSEYSEYIELIKTLKPDIGLAPLLSGSFYECKYYNKYLEYTSLGILGVYTGQAPYTDAVIDGHNGLLCKNTTESWESQISKLIDNPKLIQELFLNAFNDLKENYNSNVISKKLLAAIPELLSHKCKSTKFIKLRERLIFVDNQLIARFVNAFYDYGFKGAIKKITAKFLRVFQGRKNV